MPGQQDWKQAALGARTHSGWAVVVAVAESHGGLSVLDRRRIELADPAVRGFPQPFHAAEPLPLNGAARLIGDCEAVSRRLAQAAVESMIYDLKKPGYGAAVFGMTARAGRPLPALAGILAAHAMIHTAEGELFREVLRHAAASCRLSIHATPERNAYEYASAMVGISAAQMQEQISSLGRGLGPSWREDHKLATLAAWVALKAARGRSGTPKG